MKFIHAADLHIDSQLKGLEAYEGAPVAALRGATRNAFLNLIELAIHEKVAFIVIAGDLLDGTWQDMSTGLWVIDQFRELDRAGIRVFLLRGNHDFASRVGRAVTWPSNVHEFSPKKPETVQLPELGVALHGQGFDQQKVTQDLAAKYPESVEGLFNIGVLHTSLAGYAEHDTYAPTSLEVLVGRGYDYWALGHVHARSTEPVSTSPYVAFSGNTQGRHIREPGAKGCLLVTVDDGHLVDVSFRPTDVLRWQLVDLTLQPADDCNALLEAVGRRLVECQEAEEGRFLAVRIVVRGVCAAHHELVDLSRRTEIVTEIRNLANESPDGIWVEKIRFDTAAPVDLNQLMKGQDVIGQLFRSIRDTADSEDALRELAVEFQPLTEKAGVELNTLGLQIDDPEQVTLWLRQAEGLLASLLVKGVE